MYVIVNELAEEYGFDCDKAVDAIESNGHIQTIVNMMKPVEVVPDDDKSDDDSKTKRTPIEQARHNVQLWTKKLEANKFPDHDKKQKHIEKLEKEKKKLAKLEEGEKKTPPADKKADPPADKKVKNIPRWSKDKHGTDFKKALQENGVEFTEDREKEFRKLADAMSNEAWKAGGKTYLDHMRDYAKTVAEAVVTVESKEEDAPAVVNTLTIDELKSIKMLTPIEQIGQFWDADNGRFVTGPEENADEDFTEVTFNGELYVVGDNTRRVYKQDEKGDIFAGFMGIGKFKTLKV